MNMEIFFVLKEWFQPAMEHGCILTWFRKNMKSERESQILQEESVSLVKSYKRIS